jgi:hypothetical protein
MGTKWIPRDGPSMRDLEMTREERLIYERQSDARKIYLFKQVAFLLGRIESPPDFVPCPIDPRKT